jgi:hypothetical protein
MTTLADTRKNEEEEEDEVEDEWPATKGTTRHEVCRNGGR